MRNTNSKLTLWTMHINVVLMGIGFYMLLPLLNPHLLNTRNLSALVVGYIASARSLSSDVSMVFFGALGDKIGCKKTMMMGVGARVVGFLLFGYADQLVEGVSFGLFGFDSSVLIYMAAGILIGLGGALFLPACSAYYDMMSSDANRAQMFSLQHVLDSSGSIIGPAVGSFLMAAMDFKAVCAVCAAVYAASIVITALFLPELRRERTGTEKVGVFSTIFECARNTKFLFFLIVTSSLTLIIMQRDLTIPVKIGQISPNYAMIGMIYTIAALVGVLVQLPLVAYLSRHLKTYTIMAITAAVYTAGLTVMGFAPSILWLYIGSAIFALGGAVYMPVKSATVAEFAGRGKVAGYYGFQGLVGALINVAANVIGGALYDVARGRTGLVFYLPWIAFAGVGIAVTLFFLYLSKRVTLFKAVPAADGPEGAEN